MSGRSYLTTRRASGTLACTADEFVHPAGLHSSPSLRHVSAGHSNDAEEATDTSRSARASRRDVAGQPEPPEALDSSVGAAGTPAAHPLRRESAASYFEEARLFRTRARVWYLLI